MFFDYRKAFDTVSHRNLLSKLESLGINSYVLRWLTHYLCKCFQYACINGSNSNKLLVTSGVPQGSVLGPILIIIYINNIIHPTLFDGSMTLWYADQSVHLKTLLCYSLTLIALHLGFLQFNVDKCKYMVISRKCQTDLFLESQPPLWINGACHHGESRKTTNTLESSISQKCVAKLGKRWASSIANATIMPTMSQCWNSIFPVLD